MEIYYDHTMSDNFNTNIELGLNPLEEGPITGEYLGIINRNGENYLASRTTSAFRDDPNYLGKITVRRVTAERYPDGGGKLFVDIDENDETRALETELEEGIPEEERTTAYDSLLEGDSISVTAVRNDVFELKKMQERMYDSDHNKVY